MIRIKIQMTREDLSRLGTYLAENKTSAGFTFYAPNRRNFELLLEQTEDFVSIDWGDVLNTVPGTYEITVVSNVVIEEPGFPAGKTAPAYRTEQTEDIVYRGKGFLEIDKLEESMLIRE